MSSYTHTHTDGILVGVVACLTEEKQPYHHFDSRESCGISFDDWYLLHHCFKLFYGQSSERDLDVSCGVFLLPTEEVGLQLL